MTALMDAVATATASLPRLYAAGEVPDKPEYPYGVYHVSLGRGDAYTLDSHHGTRHGRIVVQTAGRTANAAIDHANAAVDLLLDVALEDDEWSTTPCRVALHPVVVRETDPENTGIADVTTTLNFIATRKES